MKNFSIRELQTLTGVKSHTIRCWELRYRLLSPKRSKGNVRTYSTDELRKLMLLFRLTKNGYKISRLAKLSVEELEDEAARLTRNEERQQRAVDRLIVSLYRLDMDSFEATLDDCYLSWPVGVVVRAIVYPFLKLVGLLRQGKQLNEEHFVVSTLRNKLCSGIERIESAKSNGKSILLFLPKERQLDLLLLYLHCVLKQEGWKVYYMGADVLLKNLSELFVNIKPDYLLSYFPKKHSFSFENCAAVMRERLPGTTFLVINTERHSFSTSTFENIRTTTVDELGSSLYANQAR